MLTITGKETSNYNAVKKWAEEYEINGLSKIRTQFSGVGLYYDFDSAWAYHIASWGIHDIRTLKDYLILSESK